MRPTPTKMIDSTTTRTILSASKPFFSVAAASAPPASPTIPLSTAMRILQRPQRRAGHTKGQLPRNRPHGRPAGARLWPLISVVPRPLRAASWFTVVYFCLTLPTLLSLTRPATAAQATPAAPRHTTLANGLQLVVQRDGRLPLVELTLAIDGGEVPRTPSQWRAERTAWRASTNGWRTLRRGGARRRLWRRGAVTGFSQSVAPRQLAGALALCLHQLTGRRTPGRPRPAAALGVRSPLPLWQQIRQQWADIALLRPGPPAAPRAGPRWGPNHAALVIVGDVDIAALDRTIDGLFAKLPAVAVDPTPPQRAAPQTSRRHATMRSPQAPHAMLLYGWRIPPLHGPQRPLAALVMRLLVQQLDRDTTAHTADGRPFASVRGRHDRRGNGEQLLWLEVDTPQLHPYAAAPVIDQRVAALRLRGPTSQQLDAAKQHATRQFAQVIDDPGRRAQAWAYHTLVYGSAGQLRRRLDELRSLTRADVRSFA
ncbi:MAG TPA: insulinase family protein, partial [Sorangium sp.]|nr:insulinase family protein [Sorangium sp.]